MARCCRSWRGNCCRAETGHPTKGFPRDHIRINGEGGILTESVREGVGREDTFCFPRECHLPNFLPNTLKTKTK
jgi:hypothetical protein